MKFGIWLPTNTPEFIERCNREYDDLMGKVLPSPKANQSAIQKVLKAVANKHKPAGVKYSQQKKASRKTGLLK